MNNHFRVELYVEGEEKSLNLYDTKKQQLIRYRREEKCGSMQIVKTEAMDTFPPFTKANLHMNLFPAAF